jgi:Leucine Rich repeat
LGDCPVRRFEKVSSRQTLDRMPLAFDAGGMDTPNRQPWRRYMNVSLRSLLLLVLAIGAWLGWLVYIARVQRDAVAAIERSGGWSGYDWGWKHGDKIRNGKPWAPKWLVDLIGVDFFGSVVIVVLPDSGSDAVLARIGHLSRLEKMNLSFSPVTDAGVAHLKGLTHLEELSLRGTRVTDTGVAHLAGLGGLRRLHLGHTEVTDRGLAYLEGLTELRQLHLDGTRVTDTGLAHLKGMRRLEDLWLQDTAITDAGLTNLEGKSDLIELRLDGTRVTDAGVHELGRSLPKAKVHRP